MSWEGRGSEVALVLLLVAAAAPAAERVVHLQLELLALHVLPGLLLVLAEGLGDLGVGLGAELLDLLEDLAGLLAVALGLLAQLLGVGLDVLEGVGDEGLLLVGELEGLGDVLALEDVGVLAAVGDLDLD